MKAIFANWDERYGGQNAITEMLSRCFLCPPLFLSFFLFFRSVPFRVGSGPGGNISRDGIERSLGGDDNCVRDRALIRSEPGQLRDNHKHNQICFFLRAFVLFPWPKPHILGTKKRNSLHAKEEEKKTSTDA